jgi:sortase A
MGERGESRRLRRRARKLRAAKRNVLRILPWVLIAAGLAIAAFAIISRLSVSSEQQRLVAQYRSGEHAAAQTDAQGTPQPTPQPTVTALPDPDAPQPDEADTDADPATLAVLTIPDIDLEVAVREGVGSSSLRYSVGHYAPSALPGELGNCVILGHRNYTYGQFFNRLDELAEGDTILLERAGAVYIYAVTEKFVVEPSDTYVLDPSDDAMLTLITCTPIRIATHRLIVRCALQNVQSAG